MEKKKKGRGILLEARHVQSAMQSIKHNVNGPVDNDEEETESGDDEPLELRDCFLED